MPVSRLAAPGPLVATATPMLSGRMRLKPSAAMAAACSWATQT